MRIYRRVRPSLTVPNAKPARVADFASYSAPPAARASAPPPGWTPLAPPTLLTTVEKCESPLFGTSPDEPSIPGFADDQCGIGRMPWGSPLITQLNTRGSPMPRGTSSTTTRTLRRRRTAHCGDTRLVVTQITQLVAAN